MRQDALHYYRFTMDEDNAKFEMMENVGRGVIVMNTSTGPAQGASKRSQRTERQSRRTQRQAMSPLTLIPIPQPVMGPHPVTMHTAARATDLGATD